MASGGGAVPVTAEDYELKRRWGYQGARVQNSIWRDADRKHFLNQETQQSRAKQGKQDANHARPQHDQKQTEKAGRGDGFEADQARYLTATALSNDARKANRKRAGPNSPVIRSGDAVTLHAHEGQTYSGLGSKRLRSVEPTVSGAALAMPSRRPMMNGSPWRASPLMGAPGAHTEELISSSDAEALRWALHWNLSLEDMERMRLGMRYPVLGSEAQTSWQMPSAIGGGGRPPRPLPGGRLPEGGDSEVILPEGGSQIAVPRAITRPSGSGSRKQPATSTPQGSGGRRGVGFTQVRDTPPSWRHTPVAPARTALGRGGAAAAGWAPPQASMLARRNIHAASSNLPMSLLELNAENDASKGTLDTELGLWARRELDIADWISALQQRDRAAGFRLEGAELQLQLSLRHQAQLYTLTHKRAADLQLLDLSAQIIDCQAELEAITSRQKAFAEEDADAQACLQTCETAVGKSVKQLDGLEEQMFGRLGLLRKAYKLSKLKLREPLANLLSPAAGKSAIGKQKGGVGKRKQAAPARIRLKAASQASAGCVTTVPRETSTTAPMRSSVGDPVSASAVEKGQDPKPQPRTPLVGSAQSTDLKTSLPASLVAIDPPAGSGLSAVSEEQLAMPGDGKARAVSGIAGSGKAAAASKLSVREFAESLLRKPGSCDVSSKDTQPSPSVAPTAEWQKSASFTSGKVDSKANAQQLPHQNLITQKVPKSFAASSKAEALRPTPAQRLPESKAAGSSRSDVDSSRPTPRSSNRADDGMPSSQGMAKESLHGTPSTEKKAMASVSPSVNGDCSKGASHTNVGSKASDSAQPAESFVPTSVSGAGKNMSGVPDRGNAVDTLNKTPSIDQSSKKVAPSAFGTPGFTTRAPLNRIDAGSTPEGKKALQSITQPSTQLNKTTSQAHEPGTAISVPVGPKVLQTSASEGAAGVAISKQPQMNESAPMIGETVARVAGADARKSLHAMAQKGDKSAAQEAASPISNVRKSQSETVAVGTTSEGKVLTAATTLSPTQAGAEMKYVNALASGRGPAPVASVVAATVRGQPEAVAGGGSAAVKAPPPDPDASENLSRLPSPGTSSVKALVVATERMSQKQSVDVPRNEKYISKETIRSDKPAGENASSVGASSMATQQHKARSRDPSTPLMQSAGGDVQGNIGGLETIRPSADAAARNYPSAVSEQSESAPTPALQGNRLSAPDKTSTLQPFRPATLGRSAHASCAPDIGNSKGDRGSAPAPVGTAMHALPNPLTKDAGAPLTQASVPVNSSSKSAATEGLSTIGATVASPPEGASGKPAVRKNDFGQLGTSGGRSATPTIDTPQDLTPSAQPPANVNTSTPLSAVQSARKSGEPPPQQPAANKAGASESMSSGWLQSTMGSRPVCANEIAQRPQAFAESNETSQICVPVHASVGAGCPSESAVASTVRSGTERFAAEAQRVASSKPEVSKPVAMLCGNPFDADQHSQSIAGNTTGTTDGDMVTVSTARPSEASGEGPNILLKAIPNSVSAPGKANTAPDMQTAISQSTARPLGSRKQIVKGSACTDDSSDQGIQPGADGAPKTLVSINSNAVDGPQERPAASVVHLSSGEPHLMVQGCSQSAGQPQPSPSDSKFDTGVTSIKLSGSALNETPINSSREGDRQSRPLTAERDFTMGNDASLPGPISSDKQPSARVNKLFGGSEEKKHVDPIRQHREALKPPQSDSSRTLVNSQSVGHPASMAEHSASSIKGDVVETGTAAGRMHAALNDKSRETSSNADVSLVNAVPSLSTSMPSMERAEKNTFDTASREPGTAKPFGGDPSRESIRDCLKVGLAPSSKFDAGKKTGESVERQPESSKPSRSKVSRGQIRDRQEVGMVSPGKHDIGKKTRESVDRQPGTPKPSGSDPPREPARDLQRVGMVSSGKHDTGKKTDESVDRQLGSPKPSGDPPRELARDRQKVDMAPSCRHGAGKSTGEPIERQLSNSKSFGDNPSRESIRDRQKVALALSSKHDAGKTAGESSDRQLATSKPSGSGPSREPVRNRQKVGMAPSGKHDTGKMTSESVERQPGRSKPSGSGPSREPIRDRQKVDMISPVTHDAGKKTFESVDRQPETSKPDRDRQNVGLTSSLEHDAKKTTGESVDREPGRSKPSGSGPSREPVRFRQRIGMTSSGKHDAGNKTGELVDRQLGSSKPFGGEPSREPVCDRQNVGMTSSRKHDTGKKSEDLVKRQSGTSKPSGGEPSREPVRDRQKVGLAPSSKHDAGKKTGELVGRQSGRSKPSGSGPSREPVCDRQNIGITLSGKHDAGKKTGESVNRQLGSSKPFGGDPSREPVRDRQNIGTTSSAKHGAGKKFGGSVDRQPGTPKLPETDSSREPIRDRQNIGMVSSGKHDAEKKSGELVDRQPGTLKQSGSDPSREPVRDRHKIGMVSSSKHDARKNTGESVDRQLGSSMPFGSDQSREPVRDRQNVGMVSSSKSGAGKKTGESVGRQLGSSKPSESDPSREPVRDRQNIGMVSSSRSGAGKKAGESVGRQLGSSRPFGGDPSREPVLNRQKVGTTSLGKRDAGKKTGESVGRQPGTPKPSGSEPSREASRDGQKVGMAPSSKRDAGKMTGESVDRQPGTLKPSGNEPSRESIRDRQTVGMVSSDKHDAGKKTDESVGQQLGSSKPSGSDPTRSVTANAVIDQQASEAERTVNCNKGNVAQVDEADRVSPPVRDDVKEPSSANKSAINYAKRKTDEFIAKQSSGVDMLRASSGGIVGQEARTSRASGPIVHGTDKVAKPDKAGRVNSSARKDALESAEAPPSTPWGRPTEKETTDSAMRRPETSTPAEGDIPWGSVPDGRLASVATDMSNEKATKPVGADRVHDSSLKKSAAPFASAKPHSVGAVSHDSARKASTGLAGKKRSIESAVWPLGPSRQPMSDTSRAVADGPVSGSERTEVIAKSKDRLGNGNDSARKEVAPAQSGGVNSSTHARKFAKKLSKKDTKPTSRHPGSSKPPGSDASRGSVHDRHVRALGHSDGKADPNRDSGLRKNHTPPVATSAMTEDVFPKKDAPSAPREPEPSKPALRSSPKKVVGGGDGRESGGKGVDQLTGKAVSQSSRPDASSSRSLAHTSGKSSSKSGVARPGGISKPAAKTTVSKAPGAVMRAQHGISKPKVVSGSHGEQQVGDRKGQKRQRPEGMNDARSPAKTSRNALGGAAKAKGREKSAGKGKASRRTRRPREYTDEEIESYVGRDVVVPGRIFKMRDPYDAVITGRDQTKRNSVICQFKEDDSEYWFPLDDVREWLGEI